MLFNLLRRIIALSWASVLFPLRFFPLSHLDRRAFSLSPRCAKHAPAAATAANSSVLAGSMKGCSVFWTVCAVSGFVSISEAFLQPSSILSSTREYRVAFVCEVCHGFSARALFWTRAAVVVGNSSTSVGLHLVTNSADTYTESYCRINRSTEYGRRRRWRGPCACLITRPSFVVRRRGTDGSLSRLSCWSV